MHQNQNKQNIHIPVLLNAVLQQLHPQKGDSYLDLTAGYGGHAGAILERTKNPSQAVLVDRDQTAVNELERRFGKGGVKILHTDFYTASQNLHDAGRKFNVIMADVGVSSLHLDTASRGFSINQSGPLDMRMDQSQSLTADFIVNTYKVSQLTDLIRRYGEDPKASRIAHLIVAHRPIHTTKELATIVAKAWPGHRIVHPATRTFQALRIAVNSELEQIQLSLPLWIDLLSPGGRIGVISFHSLEDRLIKQAFKEHSGDTYDASLQLLTPQPIRCDEHELVFNPRSRCAKLRAAVKINT